MPVDYWPHLGLLLLGCVAVYWHTLDVPMYLDDISSISDNAALHDLSQWQRIWAFSELRFVGYMSLALNYAVHANSVVGYHLVNIAIHLGMGVALYGMLRTLARTPALVGSPLSARMPELALAVALLFVVHPLNTQAVTYIVQRLASLVALFYLLSLWFFVLGRLADGRARRLYWIIAAGFGLLALFTKQNAVTLPAAILLLEYSFFAVNAAARRRLLRGIGWSLLALLIALAALHFSGTLGLEVLDAASRETLRISRIDYLAAQMLVLWRYVGLFFWPAPLLLDYGLLPQWRFSDWQVVLAALAHIAAMGGALFILRRQALTAVGILFFYLAHTVESGFIPIKDLMFEHRSYLPNVGLCLALLLPLSLLRERVLFAVCLALVLVLGAVSWQRNELWRDQVAFFNHAIEHAPNQPRNWVYLSKVYHKNGDNQQALEFLNRELTANEQRNGRLRLDTATYIYWSKLLRATGDTTRAEQIDAYVAGLQTSPQQRQRILLNQGNSYLQAGDYAAAEAAYRQVLAVNPAHENANINLGVVALLQERYGEAIEIFERYPQHPVSQSNLPSARAALEGKLEFEGLSEQVQEKAE
ncbi:MAG: tetratricopeptide repeat protein [Halieaceae bacterium]